VNGTLHVAFDHSAFAQEMRRCKHHWLVTYDDTPEIRANFSFAHQFGWELQYGMNNYKRSFAAKGKELFITNYPIVHASAKQLALLESKNKYNSKRGKQRQ
jgi:DNA adenine methylase